MYSLLHLVRPEAVRRTRSVLENVHLAVSVLVAVLAHYVAIFVALLDAKLSVLAAQ